MYLLLTLYETNKEFKKGTLVTDKRREKTRTSQTGNEERGLILLWKFRMKKKELVAPDNLWTNPVESKN